MAQCAGARMLLGISCQLQYLNLSVAQLGYILVQVDDLMLLYIRFLLYFLLCVLHPLKIVVFSKLLEFKFNPFFSLVTILFSTSHLPYRSIYFHFPAYICKLDPS